MADADHDLVAAAQAGDRQALERLLRKHEPAVYRFGMRMCREREDAQDVLQETLLAAVRTLPEFRGAASISTWLFTIARSFCIKKRRTSKHAPEHLHSLESEPLVTAAVADARRGPEEETAGRQLQAALDEAIGALDPMYREVLLLRDVEGLTAPEVAEVLGLTVEAVKSRLHRARVAVRERLAPAFGGEPAVAAPTPGCRDVVEAFSRRLEGEIDVAACAQLEQHLEGCETCRGRCSALRQTLAMCKTAGAAPVPTEVARSVRDALARYLDAVKA
jgi:RNA polymerase sigma-70 factor, ECF subfamily